MCLSKEYVFTGLKWSRVIILTLCLVLKSSSLYSSLNFTDFKLKSSFLVIIPRNQEIIRPPLGLLNHYFRLHGQHILIETYISNGPSPGEQRFPTLKTILVIDEMATHETRPKPILAINRDRWCMVCGISAHQSRNYLTIIPQTILIASVFILYTNSWIINIYLTKAW